MVGHRLVGSSSHYTGDMIGGRAHYDQALALYDPAKHRLLAARFGQDIRVMVLSLRSAVLWLLGYPEAALADVDRALKDARETGHAPSLMYANWTVFTQILLGNYAAANAQADELVALAEEKSAPFWKAFGRIVQGEVLARTGKASDAVHWITSGIAAYRSTGATLGITAYLSFLITAYADLRQFDEALHCIDEASAAIEKTKERWFEAEISRIAGQVALMGRRTMT
jgi:predicted ATPase